MISRWDGGFLPRHHIYCYYSGKDIGEANVSDIPVGVPGSIDTPRGIPSAIVENGASVMIWCYSKILSRQPRGAIACLADELREALGLDKWGMQWTFKKKDKNIAITDDGVPQPIVYLYMVRDGWSPIEPPVDNPEYCIKFRKLCCLVAVLGVTIQEKDVYCFVNKEGRLKVLPRYESQLKSDSAPSLSAVIIKRWFSDKLTPRVVWTNWLIELYPDLDKYNGTDFIERCCHRFYDLLSPIVSRVDNRLNWTISTIIRRLRETLSTVDTTGCL